MQNPLIQEMADLFREIADQPASAADKLESMAARLMALSRALRQGTRDTPGIGDRVQMQVVGPGGEIKQFTDTQGQ